MKRPPQKHLAEVVATTGPAPKSGLIVSIIEEALRRRNLADNVGRDTTRAHVSDAGKCPRAIYKNILGEKGEPYSTDSLINFGVGRAVEEWFAETLEALGAKVYREISVEIPNPFGGPDVPGHIDFLIIVPPDVAAYLGIETESDIVIELKSINSRSMGFMLRSGEQGRGEHRKQLRLYRYAAICDAPSTTESGEEIDLRPYTMAGWYLAYVVKDATKGEPNIHAFEVPYEREAVEDDLLFLATVNSLADREEEPGIPSGYKWSGYPCSYCSHRNYCFPRSAS